MYDCTCMLIFLATSLRRVGTIVGNFFGVTEASQQGTAETIGWEEYTERRVEVHVCCSIILDHF